MTTEQFIHWQDFATRMAYRGFEGITDRRRKRLYNEVSAFLAQYAGDVGPVLSWDESEREETTEPDPHWWVRQSPYVCDWFSEFFDEHAHDEWDGGDHRRFYQQLACCLRAGLDMAAEPSAGVVGFDIGDLRRMYPEGLPAWLTEDCTEGITTAPDNTPIWL